MKVSRSDLFQSETIIKFSKQLVPKLFETKSSTLSIKEEYQFKSLQEVFYHVKKVNKVDSSICNTLLRRTSELIRCLEDFKVQIRNNDYQNVIVLGSTTAGKSTLINYLIGNKLKVQNESGCISLIKEDSISNGPIIGSGHSSETKQVELWQSDIDKINYWDCPGFLDSRGDIQQIENMFYIQNIIKSLNNVSFLYVVNDNILDNSEIYKKARESVELLTQFFGSMDNVKKLSPSILFVITKGIKEEIVNIDGEEYTKKLPSDSEYYANKFKQLYETIKEYSSKFKENSGHKNFENLVELIVSNKIKIGIFPQLGQQNLKDQKFMNSLHDQIINTIGSIDKLNKNHIDFFNFDMGNDIKNTIGLIGNKLIEHITSVIEAIDFRLRKEIGNKILEAQDKESVISFIKEKFDLLKAVDSIANDHNEFIKVIKQIANEDEYTLIEAALYCLSFYKKLSPNLMVDYSKWKIYLVTTKANISNFIQLRKQNENETDNLLIKEESILTATQVQNVIDNSKPETQNFQFNAFLFIADRDIKALGKNLSISAIRWNLLGDKLIDISGENGISYHPDNRAENGKVAELAFDSGKGQTGSNGQDGGHGKHSGDFYGYAKTVAVSENGTLTIKTNGGQGGAGQAGGNGSNGLHGNFNLDKLKSKKLKFKEEKDQARKNLQQKKAWLNLELYLNTDVNTDIDDIKKEIEHIDQERTTKEIELNNIQLDIQQRNLLTEEIKELKNKDKEANKSLNSLLEDQDVQKLFLLKTEYKEIISVIQKLSSDILNIQQALDIEKRKAPADINYNTIKKSEENVATKINELATEKEKLQDQRFNEKYQIEPDQRFIEKYQIEPDQTFSTKEFVAFMDYDYEKQITLCEKQIKESETEINAVKDKIHEFIEFHGQFKISKRQYEKSFNELNIVYKKLKSTKFPHENGITANSEELIEQIEKLNKLTIEGQQIIKLFNDCLAKSDHSLGKIVDNSSKRGGRSFNIDLSDKSSNYNAILKHYENDLTKLKDQHKEIQKRLEETSNKCEELSKLLNEKKENPDFNKDELLSFCRKEKSFLKNFFYYPDIDTLNIDADNLNETFLKGKESFIEINKTLTERIQIKEKYYKELEELGKKLDEILKEKNDSQEQYYKIFKSLLRKLRDNKLSDIADILKEFKSTQKLVKESETKFKKACCKESEAAQKLLLALEPEERIEYKFKDKNITEKIVHCVKEIAVFNTQFKETYKISGSKGTPGGNAGVGGNAGENGKNGKQYFDFSNGIPESFSNKKKIIAIKGENGKVGEGGTNAYYLKGVYLNEYSYALIRKLTGNLHEKNPIEENSTDAILGTSTSIGAQVSKQLFIQGTSAAVKQALKSAVIEVVEQTAVIGAEQTIAKGITIGALASNPIGWIIGGSLLATQLIASPAVAWASSRWLEGPFKIKQYSAENGKLIPKETQEYISPPKQCSFSEVSIKDSFHNFIAGAKDTLLCISEDQTSVLIDEILRSHEIIGDHYDHFDYSTM